MTVISILFLLLMVSMSSLSIASPITCELKRYSKECFFLYSDQVNATIEFYFSVQHGERNDVFISYSIKDPERNSLFNRKRISQSEFKFLGEEPGEYTVCFNNESDNDKIIDLKFELSNSINEYDKSFGSFNTWKENLNPLQFSISYEIDNLEHQISILSSNLGYYKARSQRNNETVTSINKRIAVTTIITLMFIIVANIVQLKVTKYILNKYDRLH
ncbi:hypothetical protein Kpol_1037p9 [Vanderwaltozyma polyspora DSM 70294]|uniref:GOLD domain-containing protein n=1 Tax=Vanderwaltozyma polyspora (strain ATCC 22028 / DSM 70294 / BCRC 21397 / CBS 2163 / NBRC 10782 / NRRL Y-8283 / UCD 57-17) TaxID=436907 RepID=A7TJV1_VANPO|nr:uncharacterized protein Kpol_1037p9 [Vanderwaltozyma polyspora DSM 70294]EDO17413.1 hypothetical protein Kpol_1037p9 [Vanderwaltozyma polyspora DSM 70294]